MDRPKAFQAPWDSALGPGHRPHTLASLCPIVVPHSALCSRRYLHLRWPDTLALVDLADWGGESGPKELGVHAGPGPLAYPPEGAKIIMSK